MTELLKKFWSPTATVEAPKLTGVVAVDGGSLLKTINWAKNTKFQQVVQLYINYVTEHFLLPGCTVKVVFDSYPTTPTTKDSTHLRITRKSFAKIRVAENTVQNVAKPQFLSNPENKLGLVSYLADKLNAVPGVLCSKADDVADCLL